MVFAPKTRITKGFQPNLLQHYLTCYITTMAKKPKLAHGRPRDTDEIQCLLMARAHYEGGISTYGMLDLFGVKKTQAFNRLKEIREKYPELVEFLTELGETTQLAPREEVTKQFIEQEQVRTEAQAITRLAEIKKNLADTIEQALGHLLDMSPEELRNMKTEHKLKHIPELVKTMRLLREQSTENVQKLSLIKAVGIATARRSRNSPTNPGVAD